MKTVCIDLDGVLADYKGGWRGVEHIGDPIPGAKEFVDEIAKFARVVIYTSRLSDKFDQDHTAALYAITYWLEQYGFYYDEIFSGTGKCVASAYIDDRAVCCKPQHPQIKPKAAFRMALYSTQLLCEAEIPWTQQTDPSKTQENGKTSPVEPLEIPPITKEGTT